MNIPLMKAAREHIVELEKRIAAQALLIEELLRSDRNASQKRCKLCAFSIRRFAARVRAYVGSSIAAGSRLDVNVHVYSFFPSESIMVLRAASLTGDFIRALSEYNHIAYEAREPTTASPSYPANQSFDLLDGRIKRSSHSWMSPLAGEW